MPTLVHGYSDLDRGEWLRGNLHTHTLQSDGSRPPQEVIDDYASRGYGFLMLADHDVFTSETHYARWNSRGMVMIPGNELAGGPHLLHVDADRLVASRPSRQEILNDIAAACRESGHGFAVVNHPNWQSAFNHCTIEQMREWTGYLGMEIYNGVIGRLDGSPYALDKWDMLLSEGRRIWGFANDDSHHAGETELGWNTALVRERTPAGVVEALRAGRFYASTGVTIRSIRVDGMKVRIETENASRIVGIRDTGRRFAIADQAAAEFEVPQGARYARFECWGTGERLAWTQPFFVDSGPEGGGVLPYLRDWSATALLESGTLETASPEQAAAMPATSLAAYGAKEPIPGFVDARALIARRAGIVYLASTFESSAAGQGIVSLGYDGPVRVWLNGRDVFAGPGANPAVADRTAVYARFNKGANRLLVALDSNRGRAWGLFARVTPPRA